MHLIAIKILRQAGFHFSAEFQTEAQGQNFPRRHQLNNVGAVEQQPRFHLICFHYSGGVEL